jgi:hypothetical protein
MNDVSIIRLWPHTTVRATREPSCRGGRGGKSDRDRMSRSGQTPVSIAGFSPHRDILGWMEFTSALVTYAAGKFRLGGRRLKNGETNRLLSRYRTHALSDNRPQ